MTVLDLCVALVIAIGVVGVIVPLLPGSLLVAAAILVWAFATGTTTGWVVLVAALAFLVLGAVVKYVVPGKRLSRAGVPTSTMVIGGALGLVGFFVIPVVGLPIGFVAGVYLAELSRVGSQQAWPATVHALGAVGLALLIEVTSCLLAAATWAVGVVAT